MSNDKPKKSFFSRIGRFFKDMIGELKKVVWPSKKQVINNTGIVVAFMALAAIIIAGFDSIMAFVLGQMFGGGTK